MPHAHAEREGTGQNGLAYCGDALFAPCGVQKSFPLQNVAALLHVPKEYGMFVCSTERSMKRADGSKPVRSFHIHPAAFSSKDLSLVKIMRPALVCRTVVTTTATVSPT